MTILWSIIFYFRRSKFILIKNFPGVSYPHVPIDKKLSLVQVMAWCRPGDEVLPEPVIIKINVVTTAFRLKVFGQPQLKEDSPIVKCRNIYDLLWTTIFWSRLSRSANDFIAKSLANRFTSDQKVTIYGRPRIISPDVLKIIIDRTWYHCHQGRPF